MNVLFSIPLNDKHQEKLKTSFPEVTFLFRDGMDEAAKVIEKADVLVTFSKDITDSLMKQATHLKWIMIMAAGVDQLPKKIIAEKNIPVTNARGIHKIPMAEYALSMLLQVSRNEKTLIKNEQNHRWEQVQVNEISEKTLLIAGTGAIGSELARLAKAFHMKTVGVSRSGSHVAHFDENVTSEGLAAKLPEADFVVSVLPSTAETKHFFTYEHFRQLPDHAVFLNMGRGNVLDIHELVRALREREIAHAVLDVFDKEPLPADHYLWDEDNLTITPHNSGLSPYYMERAMDIFTQNLERFTDGQSDLFNQVDIVRGY